MKFCKLAAFSLVLGFSIQLLGCASTVKVDVPDGFVRYKKPSKAIKAITSQGVRLKTFRFANEPKGDLTLWANSIEEQLRQTGYQIIDKQNITTTQGLPGVALETRAVYEGNKFAYLVAVFVKNEDVFTLEAAGEQKDFEKVKDSIVKSLHTFSLE